MTANAALERSVRRRLGGEVFDFEDAERHVRFRFALRPPAVAAPLRDMRAVVEMRAPAG